MMLDKPFLPPCASFTSTGKRSQNYSLSISIRFEKSTSGKCWEGSFKTIISFLSNSNVSQSFGVGGGGIRRIASIELILYRPSCMCLFEGGIKIIF